MPASCTCIAQDHISAAIWLLCCCLEGSEQCLNQMPPKRGVTQKQRAQAILSVQNTSLQSTIDAIVEYLTAHPEEAAQCLLNLRDGFMKPASSGTHSIKAWLPDGNSQFRHVAGYFLIAICSSLDPRLNDSTLCEKLEEATKVAYHQAGTPKTQRASWAHQMLCRVCYIEIDQPVMSRYKPKFVQLLRSRYFEKGSKFQVLPLEITVGGALGFDTRQHGFYTLGDANEQGRISSVVVKDLEIQALSLIVICLSCCLTSIIYC